MSGGVEHTVSTAPQRYQRNPTVVRPVPETGNTLQASDIPPSGEPPLASGADQRDAVGPNPLPSGASLKLPPASPRQSGQGGILGRVWQGTQYRETLAARDYLAAGLSLQQAATVLSMTPADLDLALWNNLGARG